MNYIKDGLAFWLDGINKGTDDGDWVDLINGIVFNNNLGAVPLKNGFYFNSNNYLTGIRLNMFDANDCTIEAAFFDNNKGDNFKIIVTNSTNSFSIFNYFGNILLRNREYLSVTYDINKPTFVTLSSLENVTYINKNGIKNGKKNFTSIKEDTTCIGGAINSQFHGIIYSIRIYNRILSKKEILNNQEVDEKRFNKNTSYSSRIADNLIPNSIVSSMDFSDIDFTHESALSVIDGLAEVTTQQTITFKYVTYDTLTEEDIAIATNKGWTVARYPAILSENSITDNVMFSSSELHDTYGVGDTSVQGGV